LLQEYVGHLFVQGIPAQLFSETYCLHKRNRPVTLDRYSRSMTIKQVIIGAVLGSSIVGLMVHRMRNDPEAMKRTALGGAIKVAFHKVPSRKQASIRPSGAKHRNGNSETQVSSRQLFG
jgi:hypothetical protein